MTPFFSSSWHSPTHSLSRVPDTSPPQQVRFSRGHGNYNTTVTAVNRASQQQGQARMAIRAADGSIRFARRRTMRRTRSCRALMVSDPRSPIASRCSRSTSSMPFLSVWSRCDAFDNGGSTYKCLIDGWMAGWRNLSRHTRAPDCQPIHVGSRSKVRVSGSVRASGRVLSWRFPIACRLGTLDSLCCRVAIIPSQDQG